VVHVLEIDLTVLDVRLPASLVGMVVMQPSLMLTDEPLRCVPARKAAQLTALERTLEIAKIADHGAKKTHFTLFPEYSIPGLEGITRIESVLRDASWQGGTVVIGGTDALAKTEYAELCGDGGTTVDLQRNGPNQVKDGEWVNCCITWVKTAKGEVRRWLQPKITPAWPEQNIVHAHMFGGGSIFLFRCAFENDLPCRFFSLVCFDWVGIVDGHRVPRQVLTAINSQKQELFLSWVFVPQHNPKPCHTTFIGEVANFFQDQNDWPFVCRDRCCIVFANTAGRDTPGRITANGYSSLIFSSCSPFEMKGCHPTYSGQPALLRGSDALGQCHDVVFREGGACIHSFSQYLPAAVNRGAGGKSLPLHRANVHSITMGLNDPRARGFHVPGCVKWVNDSLDDLPCLSQQIPEAPLANSIGAPHTANITAFRAVESVHLEKGIDYATWRTVDESAKSKPPTADDWKADQTAALAHVVHTLDILRMGESQLDFTTTAGHAAANVGGRSVEVLAVNGPSHEECEKHAGLRFVPPLHRQVLLVSRDPHNTPRLKKDKSLFSVESGRLGAETNITDASSAQIHLTFRDLMDIYNAANTAAELEDSLYARLAS
jgi:hypothetical protein